MITSAVESLPTPVLTRQRPVGLASTAAAAACFALVVLIVGGLGPAGAGKIQLVSSIALTILSVWLLTLVANRVGLAPHVGYLMMLFGAFYWFISPAFLIALQPEIRVGERYGLMLSPASITTACLYLSGYVFAGVVTYWLSIGMARRWTNRAERIAVPDKIYLIIIALFLAGFIPYLLFGGGLENVLHAIMAGRSEKAPWKAGALGDERSALYYLSRSGLVAAAGFAGTWAMLARESRHRPLLLGIFCFTTLIVFFDGGTRSWVALAVIPTFLAWITYTMKQHLTLGKVFLCLAVICGIQFAFEFARASRMGGWDLERVKVIDPLKRKFDNDFFTDLTVCVDLVPRRRDYFYFGDFWGFVSHPVPRFLWRDKPISPILLYYNGTVSQGLLGSRGNKLPSHIGQFHMSLGMLGVTILGVLSGVISAFSSAMLSSRFVGLSHLGAVLATWWFIMARGVYPGWSYVLLFAWVITSFGFRVMRTSQST